MDPNEGTISYFVDADNRIVKVVGPWDRFALENDGLGACVEAIVGKPLDQFIAGDVSRMFVSTMLMSARTLGREVYRPYRCDSGHLKRFMEMTIIPQDDGLLEVRHRTLHTEPLRTRQFVPTQRRVSAGLPRTKRCSMCNKVHVESEWMEIEDAMHADLLTADRALGPWIFGVCPKCLERNGAVL